MGKGRAVTVSVAAAFAVQSRLRRIGVTGVLSKCVACVCVRACEVPSFICACVHAGISQVCILAGLVSAGSSIGQADLLNTQQPQH